MMESASRDVRFLVGAGIITGLVRLPFLVDVSRALLLVGLLAVTVAIGTYWRSRQGGVREVLDGDVLTAAELGVPLGERATLLQFSSVACAPCRAADRILGEAASRDKGLTHVDLDAAQHLDLVRRLNVLRTPTVFVLDARGRVAHRFSGVPTPAGLATTLADVVRACEPSRS